MKKANEKVKLKKERKNGLIEFSPLKITKRNQHVFTDHISAIPLSFHIINGIIFFLYISFEQKNKESKERKTVETIFSVLMFDVKMSFHCEISFC